MIKLDTCDTGHATAISNGMLLFLILDFMQQLMILKLQL